ncbi:MAG: hypothetical protein KME03_16930 [Aphanocapsa lilacina HA4352-LM1]|jgi:tetratricopeptide (TPR) repeat protein|nr:hypothetical protein [Aphanocapsa lilacina HA4352-LM1]
MAERAFYWLANASYRRRQWVQLLVLGAIFTLLGGFGAFARFGTQMLGEYYLLTGETAPQTLDGQRALRQAAALRPDWARPHLSLSQAFYSDDWYEGAIREANRAFELSTDPIEKSFAISIVGFSHMGAGRNAEARDALKLAVELDPNNAKAQTALEQLQQKEPAE